MAGPRPDHLVLIPGAGSFASIWDPVVAGLPSGITVHPVDHLALDDLGAIARALVGDLPDRFALMGHSFGNHVALAVLAAAPERVESLVVVATSTGPEIDVRMDAMLARLADEGYDAVVEGYRTAYLDAGQDPALVDEMVGTMHAYGAERFTANIRALRNRPDWADPLGALTVPSLFVAAADDTTTPPAGVRALADLAPGSTYVEIPDCTHAVPTEKPSELAAIVTDWWAATS